MKLYLRISTTLSFVSSTSSFNLIRNSELADLDNSKITTT